MTTTPTEAAIEKRDNGPVAIIKSHQKKLADVLPEHIQIRQFVGQLTGALFRDPKLMEAAQNNPGELMNVAMRCAALGHSPATDEFYLIPRKKKGRLEVQGIEGYRGIVERMYRSGAVASVIVREVCENDEFDYVEGEMDRPRHKVNWFGGGRGQMIGVYAYAILTTGAVSRVVILSKDDVMAAKASSDGAESSFSPWNRLDGGKDRPEFTGRSMWWKTAARRLEPWVPTSAEYRREQLRAAVEADNLRKPSVDATSDTSGYVDMSTGEIHDAELVDDAPSPFSADQATLDDPDAPTP